jgi:hypothetical protein
MRCDERGQGKTSMSDCNIIPGTRVYELAGIIVPVTNFSSLFLGALMVKRAPSSVAGQPVGAHTWHARLCINLSIEYRILKWQILLSFSVVCQPSNRLILDNERCTYPVREKFYYQISVLINSSIPQSVVPPSPSP